jgi:NAD(P)-dependent dehydrogenase (short-subunit alcohol dehydrogenase family)
VISITNPAHQKLLRHHAKSVTVSPVANLKQQPALALRPAALPTAVGTATICRCASWLAWASAASASMWRRSLLLRATRSACWRAGVKTCMLDRIEAEITGSKGFVCDVSESEQVHAAVASVTAELGPIDVLIVNTSAGAFKPFDSTTEADFELALKTERLPLCD